MSDSILDLQIGVSLIPPMLEGGLRRIGDLRHRLATEGFYLPTIRVRDNIQLAPHCYRIEQGKELLSEGAYATLGDILQNLSELAKQEA